MSTPEKPAYLTDEHLEFLDDLRDSGATNMFGAPKYLKKEFSFSEDQAREVTSYWMRTFSARQKVKAS